MKINCRTSNVVYAVHCKKCKHIVYVGETETMLKDRIQNHLSDIRTCKKKYDKPVSIHFNSKGHSIDDFIFAGIEISKKKNTIYRQTRESLFIIPSPTKLRRDIVTLPSVLPSVCHILVNTLGSTSFNGFWPNLVHI